MVGGPAEMLLTLQAAVQRLAVFAAASADPVSAA